MKKEKKSRKMKTAKNAVLIVVLVLLAAAAALYFGYSATLVNPNNEKSISNYLSKDKNLPLSVDKSRPVKILKTEKYKNYSVVLFVSPAELDTNKNSAHLYCFEKSKFYPGRYKLRGGTDRVSNEKSVLFTTIEDENTNTVACFIANMTGSSSRCSVFEFNENGNAVLKPDEPDVPGDNYLILREYKLKSKKDRIAVFDGSISLDEMTEK